MEVIFIDDLIGVRYKVNGRDAKKGLDCFGLVLEVEKRFGHIIPDITETKVPNYDFLKCKEKIQKMVKVKEIKTPKTPGDIVFIKNSEGVLHHIGVFLGNNMLIHCNREGVHIDRLTRLTPLVGKVYTWL